MPSLFSAEGKDVTQSFAFESKTDLKYEAKDVARLQFLSLEEEQAAAVRMGSADGGELASLHAAIVELEARLQHLNQTMPQRIDEARELALALARGDWQLELDQRLDQERAMIGRACEEFARERTRYFAAVEAQVVKLALAIAARVLHREARMDPLLLSAAVRVALEKVEEGTETRLRVPSSEAALWKAEFEAASPATVSVIVDEGLARGECILDTSVGTVQLGIEAQLAEIERGFFDLMQKRPA